MLLDVDLVFNDLQGYEFYHYSEVSAVISDKVKCVDGAVVDFIDNIEFSIYDGDEILIMRRRYTVEDLEGLREYMASGGDCQLDDFLVRNMAIAKKEGYSVSYVAIVNDEVFGVYNFSI